LDQIYFITGPTAVGKSSLALKIAQKYNGVIINADSMQVYSNLRILTARPSSNDHKKIIHKLYGHVNGSKRYNVSKWCDEIKKIINENIKDKILSIVVGGTGMYIDKLINGIIDMPEIPEIYKKKSEELLKSIGLEKLIQEINTFDSQSLKKISLNDNSRIRRIWEVFNSTGITFTDWKKTKNKTFLNKLSFKIFLINPPRDKIYENANLRFKEMLEVGAIDEVKELMSLQLDKSLPIMRAHGVPEISKYLNNYYSFEECIVRGQQVTRNYVKRQLTWWRSSTLPIHQVFHQFSNEIDVNLIKK